MQNMLLTSPIISLAELKREGLRVDRWLKNTVRNMRNRAAVNEIEKFQTLDDLPDAITVEEFNRQRKGTRGRYEDGQGCRDPLHALVCYKCGKGADFYRKHPSREEPCPIKRQEFVRQGRDSRADKDQPFPVKTPNPKQISPHKSLEQREGEYELARERIFTGSEDADSEPRTTRKIMKLYHA